MNFFKKLIVRISDKLYTYAPARDEDGNKMFRVGYDYNDEEKRLELAINNLCFLIFEDVSEQTLRTFNDIKSKNMDWEDIKAIAELIVWFKVRGCECYVAEAQGTFYEDYMSSRYCKKLGWYVNNEYIIQNI